jgi:hypothetical protein
VLVNTIEFLVVLISLEWEHTCPIISTAHHHQGARREEGPLCEMDPVIHGHIHHTAGMVQIQSHLQVETQSGKNPRGVTMTTLPTRKIPEEEIRGKDGQLEME